MRAIAFLFIAYILSGCADVSVIPAPVAVITIPPVSERADYARCVIADDIDTVRLSASCGG